MPMFNFGGQAQLPQQAQPQGGGFLQQLLAPENAMPIVAALMGQQGNGQNFANAFSAYGQTAAQTSKRNKTLDFLRREAPELASAVDSGMDTGDAYKVYLQQRYAKPAANPFSDRAAAAQQYGLDPNSEEGRAFILSGDLPSARGGAAETGLVPQMMRDPKTNKTIFVQPTKDGRLIPSNVPEGYEPFDPYQKAFQTNLAKSQSDAAFDLPRVEQNAKQTLDILDRMENHPGREGSTGFIQGILPSRSEAQVDFQSLVDQTQGQSFLQAFQMLKGGGQITEVEGQKATDAISRLHNQRLSDADYLKAIQDLKEVVNNGLARARLQAGPGGGQAPQGGGVVDYRDYFGGQ
jgi:hypothetical protein